MSQCARVNGSCKRCEGDLPFEFTMAFQPIVDLSLAQIVTYEALVRGPQGESAWSVISQVTDDLLYRFDQACRVKAIEMASALDMQTDLSINFLPNAVYEPKACIQATLEVSSAWAGPPIGLFLKSLKPNVCVTGNTYAISLMLIAPWVSKQHLTTLETVTPTWTYSPISRRTNSRSTVN
ncbi:hypothetical protein HORIV_10540 [Vreelandella olivaria]|uniref:EAL domain-containing protein n=1 Tax=Vreelandella olivaria TaxID=390919 RepID=A0ABM7GDP6_9GAMM|nr:hypothetical protein HORIV_10540 [Halomonas olivaria]